MKLRLQRSEETTSSRQFVISGWKCILVSVAALFILFILGSALLERSFAKNDAYRSLGLFEEALQLIEKNYVEQVNPTDIIRSAYQGMLQSLDVYATYIAPDQMKDFRWPPAPVGALGFDVYKRRGYGIVLSLLSNSPASNAGLQAGDYIRSIGDESTRTMSLLEIRAALEGAVDSQVKLKLMRADTFEQYDATLTRKHFKIPEPHSAPLQDAAFYVGVDSFDAGTADRLGGLLAELSNKGTDKIVLDLRDCSSGDYEEAILAANLFVQSGDLSLVEGRVGRKRLMRQFPRLAKDAKVTEVVSARDKEPGQEEYTIHFEALPRNYRCNVPVALLVNGTTAGPAEVFAIALKDRGRASLVGAKTAGTCSLQELLPVDNAGGLVLTVAKFVGPSGTELFGEGITPAVVQEAQPGARYETLLQDPAVQKALENLEAEARAKEAA